MNMIYRNLALQALVGVMAVSLLAAKGCTVDGDASLGDDEKPDASAGASAGKSAGTAGKSGTNTEGGATLVDPGTAGKSTAQGGATLDPGAGGATLAEGGATLASGGAPDEGVCALPLDTGPCKGNLPSYGFGPDGHCELFTYGGCQGNANRFATLAECQAACGDAPTCPSHLLTLEVFEVAPLNRPEMACIFYANPLHVGCSQLINPTLTVPTDWPNNPCVTKDGKLYKAGTTLPKADGWQDCTPQENELVAKIGDCADLP
jgi:hypothetical protein